MTREPEEPLALDQVRSKAVAGVLSVGVRNLLVRGLGLLGTVVLARLLDPRDFGLLALGLTLKLLGSLLAAGGLGAGLIQRAEPPTDDELRSVLAFQLAGGTLIVLVVGVLGLVLGGASAIAAIMTLSIPIAVANTPARILLERSLDWNLLARAEVASALVFNLGAIGLVLLGAGVWGVAVATLAEASAASAILIARGPAGFMRPLFTLGPLRPILRFGLAYQAVPLVITARDQGLNVLIAATGGLAVLGIWTVAFRIFLAITLLVEALWRVSFPAMSRMLEAGAEPREMIESALRLNVLAFGVLAVAVGGTAPDLVPTFFGRTWNDAIDVLPWGAAALMVAAPLSTAGLGFIQARGEGRMVQIFLVEALVWLATAAVLVPVMGAEGAGIAMLAGGVAFVLFMLRVLRRHARVRFLRYLRLVGVPSAAALAAGAAGWVLAEQIDPAGLGWILSLIVGEVIYVLMVVTARKEDCQRLISMLSGAANSAFPGLGRLGSLGSL